jgi:predicted nucleic acid-binding protein
MRRGYVLDASAILDFLENNPGSERTERLFQDSRDQKITLLMSVVNWGEVFYHVWQRHGEESARRALASLSRISIELVPVDERQSLQACEIKVLHKIPYVDSLAAALAVLRQATLVTSDRDFEKLGRRVPVVWVRK